MTNKSKLKKSIVSLSITSMLALSLSNSMFIHGTNSTEEFVPNISNELKSGYTHDINEYTIRRVSQSDNNVRYTIDYKEDGVWYWNQEKSDYVKKKWNQYSYDDWYYGPEISIGQSGDDMSHTGSQSYAPEFTIKYTGDRPSHKVEHPAIPDDPETPWDDSVDGWTETVMDDWPNPSSHAFSSGYSGFRMVNSWTPDSNSEYTFEWTNFNSEMNSFPKLNKHWEYVRKDEGEWNQCRYDHWDWTGNDYWNSPDRANTGEGNKDVYVEWKISSNDHIIESGTEDIKTNDIIETSASNFASMQSKPPSTEYETTDSERHSSTAPYINVPEPDDSPWYSVDGSEDISITNLPLGWEYLFEADLMYVDKNGVEHVYEEYTDTFSTSKTNDSSIIIDGWSDNEDSVVFTYELIDEHNIRESDVRWTLDGDMGTHYEGTSQSNFFEQSFEVNENESVTFSAQYDYSLSNNLDGTANVSPSAITSKTISTGTFYEDEIETFEIWVDNIQDDSLVFNYYISTNNNFLSEDYSMTINANEYSAYIENPKVGTNSILVPLAIGNEPLPTYNVSANLNNSVIGDSRDAYLLNGPLDINTNLITDFSMRLINNEYIYNTEAAINYVFNENGIDKEINNIQYNLNGEWYDLDYEVSEEIQTLNLYNLEDSEEYEIYFKATTDYTDYFSNTFKFKTDRSPSIYIDEGDVANSGENSVSMTFTTDKYEYLDETEFTWGVMDMESENMLYERKDYITNNGQKTIFADGLESNHDYRMIVNAVVEDEIKMVSADVSTYNSKNDKINNSYIEDITRSGDTYTAKYSGKLNSVQYSLDGIEWKVISPSEVTSSTFEVTIPNDNEDGYISLRLNNQMRSQSTYYKGVDSTLIKPKDPFNFNWNLFIIIMVILFVALTISLASVWAWWHSNKKQQLKIEGNVWKQE